MHKVSVKSEEQLKKLDRALTDIVNAGVSNAKVWRKLANIAININPKIREEVIVSIQEAKEARINSNEFGTNETDSMRSGLKFPMTLLMLIETLDPDITKTNDGLLKLRKAFPEFACSKRA